MTTEQDSEQQLDQAIAALPRQILPDQDLWLQIEPQLQPRQLKKPGRFAGGLQLWAAAVVFAVLSAIGWRTLLIPELGDTQLADIGEETGWVVAEQVLIETFETVKAEKLGNVGRVSEYYGDWHFQLAVWDEAIEQVREALYVYPDEPVLWSQMQGLYQQQIAYLHQISAVGNNEFSWMGNEP